LFKNIIIGLFVLLFSLDAKAFSLGDVLHTVFSRSESHSAVDNSNVQQNLLSKAEGLNPKVLNLALNAYQKLHQQGYDDQQMLTIVDYTKPSTEPRLWVLDLKNLQVKFHELVAHAKNSGGNLPTVFSDNPRSLQSSIGVYLTSNTYYGEHGYSLKLNGLEEGFNDKARARSIVMHPAEYVSEAFARIHGRLGRSWGCFAVNPAVSSEIISNIKDGTVLFAYYPDSKWLSHSRYLSA
jgi:hypothetical protein